MEASEDEIEVQGVRDLEAGAKRKYDQRGVSIASVIHVASILMLSFNNCG